MDASDSREVIVSILDGILKCIFKNTSDDNDQTRENTLISTTSREIDQKQCTNTDSISAKEQEEQDAAVNIAGEVIVAVDAAISTNDEKSLKEEFIKAINLNVSPMKNSKDNTIECRNHALRTEQLKTKSVHFCSPIASFHEHYVSQDSCTQSLSDIDELTEILGSDFDAKQEKEQCKDKDDHISGNLASLMTPAGDCTNNLVVGCSMSKMSLIHDHNDAKTLLIEENNKDTVKDIIDDTSNKAGEVLVLSATTKDAIILKNEESGTGICETEKKETDFDKGLPCANSSPDLFDNCTTDSFVSNIVTEHDNTQTQSEKTPREDISQDSADVELTTGIRDTDTGNLTEQMVETIRFENTCKKDLKTTQDAKCTTIPSNITDNTSTSTERRCSGNKEITQGTEISKISYLDIDSEQQKVGGNKLCYETTNDSSQDLFKDVENRAEITQQCYSDEKALQLTPDLFCYENLEEEFESNNDERCSNKREIFSPDSDIQPSKKQKMNSYTEIEEKGSLKRMVHFVEENVTEMLSSPKKIRLSTYDENETPCAFIPKALKLLAAEHLEILKEEELWSRNTDQKSKETTSIFQTEATPVGLSELDTQCGIQEGSGEKSGDQFVVSEEVLESECTSIEIKELDHQKMDGVVDNNKVAQNENVLTERAHAADQDGFGADTKKVSQSSTEQFDEVKFNTLSHTVVTEDTIYMCHNDKTEIENTDCEKSKYDNENELIANVSDENFLPEKLSENLGNKESIIEDLNINMTQTDLKGTEDTSSLIDTNKIDMCDFVSATEYLSQSSQGSSTGFTYDKNLSPELLCDSQAFRSLSGYMAEDGMYNDGPETVDADHFSQPTLITVELAAEPSKESEVDIETLDIMVSHAVDHLVPDDDVAAKEDADNPEGYSMFGKCEDKKSKFYSCDMDICDKDDKPMCSPVDKRGDTVVPSSSTTSCFKWRYAPSCDTDLSPVAELQPEDTIVRITPIVQTCHKPLRLGLSKKRQPLHRLHKF